MQEDETKKPKQSPLYSDFAYDDAFRTMETECDDIVIPFVNYFYGEHFSKNALITRLRNEHFIEHQDKSGEKRITDSHFEISENDISKSYHFECESKTYDNSLMVRIFEYDSQVALDNSEREKTTLRVKFPNTGILLLRRSDKVGDTAKIIIEIPKGEVEYDVKIMKMSDFDIDKIFESHLYLMIPFYIFNFERELNEINADDSRAEALAQVFENITDRLDRELDNGNLSAYSHDVIIRLTGKVIYKLTMNHTKVQEKVGGLMGGKVLDLPEVRVFHEGKVQGIAEGKAEGEAERQKLLNENEALLKEIEKLKKELNK